MTRKNAFLIHFLLSALVVGTVVTVVFIFWYPQLYFKVVGAAEVLMILIVVDLVLGPLLTLILFKPGKWGLKFDISMVVAVQLVALVYGVHTLYQERPYYAVFVMDRFEILALRDIDQSKISDPALQSKPWNQPIYVVATMPVDMKEQQRVLEETIFEGKPDIHLRPEYWSPYIDKAEAVSKGARSLDQLLERRPDMQDEINTVMQRSERSGELAYVPIMGRQRVFSLVLDTRTWMPVDVIDIDPWDKSPGGV